MLLRLVWICCLIVVGAAATLWFLNQYATHTETTAATTSNVPSNTPSTKFSNIKMIINSAQGTPQYKLSSPEYWLYHEEQRAELTLPDITIYSDNGGKIFATALKGRTHDGNNIITLIDNVKINQPISENNPYFSKIITDRLTVFPESQRATTNSAVTAIRKSHIVKASGMTLDLNTQVLHLHGDVEGYYEP